MTEFNLRGITTKQENEDLDVSITGNIIISLIDNGIDVFNPETKIKITNCSFYLDNFNFFKDPLTWLAIKILKKKYMKSNNIKEIKEDENMTCIYFHNQSTIEEKEK